MTPDPTQDIIELRLPLKLEYLNVIRATVGVIAGAAFWYYLRSLHADEEALAR